MITPPVAFLGFVPGWFGIYIYNYTCISLDSWFYLQVCHGIMRCFLIRNSCCCLFSALHICWDQGNQCWHSCGFRIIFHCLPGRWWNNHIYDLFPRKLTCPQRNCGWKTTFLLKWSLFRGHVSFRGSTHRQQIVFQVHFIKWSSSPQNSKDQFHLFS